MKIKKKIPPKSLCSISVALVTIVSMFLFVGTIVLNGYISIPSSKSTQVASNDRFTLRNNVTISRPGPLINDQINSKRKKIAYAITVTKDGPFVDGALVLGYSALRVHNASKGFHSKYDADLIAFVVPSVVSSRQILSSYGWKIVERSLPVALSEIQNQDYAQRMKDSGCCGADEFLKLWAYTLEDYHRVVHLDMDSIVFQNMVMFSWFLIFSLFFLFVIVLTFFFIYLP